MDESGKPECIVAWGSISLTTRPDQKVTKHRKCDTRMKTFGQQVRLSAQLKCTDTTVGVDAPTGQEWGMMSSLQAPTRHPHRTQAPPSPKRPNPVPFFPFYVDYFLQS